MSPVRTNKTEDHILANLIMNSVVLLQDSKPGYQFDPSKLTAPWTKNKKTEIASRMLYLQQSAK